MTKKEFYNFWSNQVTVLRFVGQKGLKFFGQLSYKLGHCGWNKVDHATGTGKSLSEDPLFAEHRENMLCTKIVLNVRNNFCTQHVLPRFELGIFMYWTCNSMNNLSSYFGLIEAKVRASDKDLPVLVSIKVRPLVRQWKSLDLDKFFTFFHIICLI